MQFDERNMKTFCFPEAVASEKLKNLPGTNKRYRPARLDLHESGITLNKDTRIYKRAMKKIIFYGQRLE
jgi:hypothetical protein